MSINLAAKYDTKIVEQMSHVSYLQGKTNTDYSFVGVKTLKVTTLVPQALADYQRTGTNRYGTPKELEDTIQEMSMKKDRAFSMTIDKGNNMEQQMIKTAAKAIKLQNEQMVVPEIDKYALGEWLTVAKKGKGVKENQTLADGDAVLAALAEARSHFVNKHYYKDLYCYMPSSVVSKLILSNKILGIETLAKNQITNGVVGQMLKFIIVEIPDEYLANTNFLITYKGAVLNPIKLHEATVHDMPQGVSGALIEGRYMYDAFVLDTHKEGGLYCNLTGAKA